MLNHRQLKISPQGAALDSISSSSRQLLTMNASELDSGTDMAAAAVSSLSLLPSSSSPQPKGRTKKAAAFFRTIFHMFPSPSIPCRAWTPFPSDNKLLGNRVTGTLFGQRKGHVYFSVQEDPRAEPVLLLELATPTNSLVKEMASGLVRIALECERRQNRGRLFLEPVWTMYCNGRKTGYAFRKACSEINLQILTIVQAVSMGAGVLPKDEGGPESELMYMRARFERVVGSKDSEAFYMMNPDGTGGPELSIFLLRI